MYVNSWSFVGISSEGKCFLSFKIWLSKKGLIKSSELELDLEG